MAFIFDLPDDLLITILTMLVMSCNGGADLARLSATCQKFMILAREVDLKVVNFEGVSMNEYEKHLHMRGLLYRCARAGNLAAKSRLAKALLLNDALFRNMILEYDEPLLVQNASTNGVLCHKKLVRTFIRDANDAQIAMMRIPLLSYTISFLGYEVARGSRMLLAFTKMCSHYISRLKYPSRYVQEDVENKAGEAHRESVLKIYDEVFGLSHEGV